MKQYRCRYEAVQAVYDNRSAGNSAHRDAMQAVSPVHSSTSRMAHGMSLQYSSTSTPLRAEHAVQVKSNETNSLVSDDHIWMAHTHAHRDLGDNVLIHVSLCSAC